MNDIHSPVAPAVSDETSFIDWLIVLVRRKTLVLGLPVLFAVVAVAVSFALPDIYRATTKILPPQQSQSGAAAMLNQLSGLAGSALGVKNSNDLYISMLKSRTVADRLIQRFDLKKVYDKAKPEATRNMLGSNSAILAGKDGLIVIEVEDKDPKLAAQIANAYVDELFKVTSSLAISEASQRRVFFERQLQTSKDKLAQAEAELKGGLDTRGVVSVDSQSRAILETVARLRAQISAKEIQLGAMQAFVTANNQDYKRTQQELGSMRAELAKLENGSPSAQPRDDQPNKQVGLDSIKLLRDVKYYEMLYELLAKQYEVARLDESKDAPLIQILDKAIEPENKVKPRRSTIAIVAAMLGLALAVFWVLLAEAIRKSGWSGRARQ